MVKQALREARSIAIVGLEKNTGKTTVLNHLVDVSGEDRTLLLTSIGYDGESVDQVTGTSKPRIFVPAGTLIATARKLLPRCTVEREILKTTGLSTAMGEVIVFRALSAGYVELAGPSLIKDMKNLVEGVLKDHECLPIIDGALSRLSSAGHGLASHVILCTGASVDRSFSSIMERTLLAAEQLTFPKTRHAVDFQGVPAWLLGEKDIPVVPQVEGSLTSAEILNQWQEEPVLALKGLLSQRMALDLLKWKGFTGRTVILEDSTRLMVTPATFKKLKQRNIRFEVLESVKLPFIALNPTSPLGWTLNEAEAVKVLSASGVPVINVRRDQDGSYCQTT